MAKYYSRMSLANSVTVLLRVTEREKSSADVAIPALRGCWCEEHALDHRTEDKVVSPEMNHKNQREDQRRIHGRRGDGGGP